MAYVRYEHVLWQNNAEQQVNSTSYTANTYMQNQHVYLHEASKYVSIANIYMEVTMKSATATSNDTYVQLYSSSTADESNPSSFTTSVGSSETISSSTTRNVYSSSALTLTDGYRYYFKARNEATAVSTTVINKVAIVIIDSNAGSSTSKVYGRHPFHFQGYSTSWTTTSSSYSEPTDCRRFYFGTGLYAGTVTCYLETNMKWLGGTSNGYVEVYDVTAGAQVSGSEILSTNQTYFKRQRSSSFTLTNGDNFCLRIKSGDGSSQQQLGSAYLIIEQTGNNITATQYPQSCGGNLSTTSTTYPTVTTGMFPYESAHWTSSTPSVYETRTYNISNGAASVYAALTTRNSSTVLSGTETSSSSTSKDLEEAYTCTPTAATRYQQAARTTNASYTAYCRMNGFLMYKTYTATASGKSIAFIFG